MAEFCISYACTYELGTNATSIYTYESYSPVCLRRRPSFFSAGKGAVPGSLIVSATYTEKACTGGGSYFCTDKYQYVIVTCRYVKKVENYLLILRVSHRVSFPLEYYYL